MLYLKRDLYPDYIKNSYNSIIKRPLARCWPGQVFKLSSSPQFPQSWIRNNNTVIPVVRLLRWIKRVNTCKALRLPDKLCINKSLSLTWLLLLSLAAAAAAAKSLQLCPTLCDPIDGSPPGSPVPGVLQARTLEWVAISFSNAWKWKVKGKLLSCVQLLVTPWTAAHQTFPSMGFSRHWSLVHPLY